MYNPPVKQLLAEAKATLGGLPMLVYQGAAAFERRTGVEAPMDVMFDAAGLAMICSLGLSHCSIAATRLMPHH